jgi:hypothetical protein
MRVPLFPREGRRIIMADSKRKTLYEDSLFRLVWDEETKVLESTQMRQMSSQEFRATLERLLVFMKDKKARKYLADMSDAGNIAPEDLVYSETEWFARARSAGVKTIAVVMPKSLSGHMALDRLVDRNAQAQGVARMLFKDVESAREWIVKQ